MVLSGGGWFTGGMLTSSKNNQKSKCDSEVILCPKFNPKTFPKEKFPNSFSFYILNLKLCDSMKKMKVKMKEVHWWFCIVGFYTHTHTHTHTHRGLHVQAGGNTLVNAESHAHFTLFSFCIPLVLTHTHSSHFCGLTELWSSAVSIWAGALHLSEQEHCICLSRALCILEVTRQQPSLCTSVHLGSPCLPGCVYPRPALPSGFRARISGFFLPLTHISLTPADNWSLPSCR